MSNNVDIGPKKTMFILVVVIGCFSVLWPKVFYPMLVGSAKEQMKPNAIDKTSGCCDVISEIDVNTIKLMMELCNGIVNRANASNAQVGRELLVTCRSQILATCGIDINAFLQEQVRLGHSTKRILDEIRSFNGSLCLKYNFGIAPWRIGVPHRVTVNIMPSIRQERPSHLRPEMLHPALRERGRAIPASATVPRIVDGRQSVPILGMRPPMGGPGHVVPPPQKGTSTMSVVMPIYTVGIVIFFTYTLMKLMFKKPVDATTSGIYPPIQPDESFRKQVFEAEPTQYVSRHAKEEVTTKLGWKERETIVNAMSALLAEVDQEREQDEKLRAARAQQDEIISNGNVTADNPNISNGTVANGSAVKPQEPDDSAKVKILGMETTASCEGGQKWSRPNSPMIPASPMPPAESVPPPQSIYLEGSLPAQSQLLVSESATEMENGDESDAAVVLSGKMTLSVISLDSIVDQVENGKAMEEMVDNEEEEEEEIIIDEDDAKVEESKYTTASNATHAENDYSEEEKNTDDEDNEMERD